MTDEQSDHIHEAANQFRQAIEDYLGSKNVIVSWVACKTENDDIELVGGNAITEKEWEGRVLTEAMVQLIHTLTEYNQTENVEDNSLK